MYHKITEEDLKALHKLVGQTNVTIDKDELKANGKDETEDLEFLPEVVVFPNNTEHVAAVIRYCNTNNIPVTPCGARTGLSGGALCVHGGVALSMAKMNRILEIDTLNHQVVVEPGVITQVLQEAVAEKGLYYAPDPASRGSCFIGGNLAENSGGPRAVKYGVTQDWVLNLEVVLPDGRIIETGARTLKNATGYNLTQLFIGSEGTLGVITRAVLKLIPLPAKNKLLLAPFKNASKACEAVAAIFSAGITPSALEFMEKDAIDLSLKMVEEAPFPIDSDYEAHLLIEVDGDNDAYLISQCETIFHVLEAHDCGEIQFAEDQSQKDKLWILRRKVGEAVKAHSIYKEEDTVVPRYALPKLLEGVKRISAQYGFQCVCYGHAGDGNLHVNILKGDLSDEKWRDELPDAIHEIFTLTVELGGTLSGEHGIGWVQKSFMNIAFSNHELECMQNIKNLFDPMMIMNPGKILPDL